MERSKRYKELLIQLYGSQEANLVLERLVALIEAHRPNIHPKGIGLSQRDCFLITYPDQIQEEGIPPLRSLADFCKRYVADVINNIHILPFYPWTSDDGFSVADYRSVAVHYGSWADIQNIENNFRLMFDAVINHTSVASLWFQGLLAGDPRYQDYYVMPPADADLSQVVRPRSLPLLTRFETSQGPKEIWTTFSADQADLNFKNPAVLLEIADLLLFYVEQGASFLRMDAIAYLWKEPGTTSIHLPQAHALIKLFRAILEEAAPHVHIVTETNVPHAENISYFGDGTDEAHLVYNFPLPPLMLHAIQQESAKKLTEWARGLVLPSGMVTFFNFLASHDGIGLNPLRDLLNEDEIEEVVRSAQGQGGLVSFKDMADGSRKPYELNINYFDALNDPGASEPAGTQIDRFLAAHAVLMCMPGIPAIYFHSLVGMRGWPEGVRESGRNRSINRQKLESKELEARLSDSGSQQAQVFHALAHLLRVRAHQEAFDPHGSWQIIDGPHEIFGILRMGPAGDRRVLCLQNLSSREVRLPPEIFDPLRTAVGNARDIISGRSVPIKGDYRMQPYEVLWIV